MKIEFVNHASFVAEQDGVKLLIDPWLEGYAFYEGWAHLSKTKFSYEEFKTITHIWFSHEHPDHFSPPVLNKIPLEYRKGITILYQKTADKKVIEVCKKMQFGKVVELSEEWVSIGNNFKVYNKPHTDGDSWLCIKTADCTVLNVNDCVMESEQQTQEIKDIAGDIDVLFTQFSYANWAGNKEDQATRKKAASDKLQEMLRQSRIFQPKVIIPFASFIWFCHEENFYLNDGVNKIDFVYDFLVENTTAKPVVLYPGDTWITNDKNHNSSNAIQSYMQDWNNTMTNPPMVKTKSIEKEKLFAIAKQFAGEMLSYNTFFIKILKPTKIYVTDYCHAFEFTLNKGLVQKNLDPSVCDVELSSDALYYCFKFLWGGSTLRVNGRYQVPAGGNFFNFKIYFQISQLNNFGEKFDFKYLFNQFASRLKRVLFK